MKILLLDDEKDLTALIKDMLEDYNFHVTIANEPLTALDIVKSKKLDVIITDIKMPQMDGIEFMYEVRKINKSIPVLFITSDCIKDFLQLNEKIKNCLGCLYKPNIYNEILTTLESFKNIKGK